MAKRDNKKQNNVNSVNIDGIGSRFRLVNSSRNIFIFPINEFKRETILPSQNWDVPDEHIEMVKRCLKGSYYQAIIDKGLLKVVTAKPSRLDEEELTEPETPEAPPDLTKTAESVTQAEFVESE